MNVNYSVGGARRRRRRRRLAAATRTGREGVCCSVVATHNIHTGMREQSHPLWPSVFPNAQPAPLLQLPSCAQRYRVFVYDLPQAFHAGLLTQMEKQRGRANCDFARSPCIEVTREPTYSSLRQYEAEVPLLAKLLLMPQARRPEDADLIVVPWLASTELSAEQRPWYPKNPIALERFQAMRGHLTHFEGPLRSRHLFLSSRDWTFTVVPLRDLITESGALLATYGPRRPHRRNELLVAPNDAGFGKPLARLAHPPRLFLFAMFDESINRIRQDFGAELRRLNASYPQLRISLHPIVDHKTLALSPEQTHAQMSDSLLCPIIQGDLPYQHRLFDALACGCVPLLVAVAGNPTRKQRARPLPIACRARLLSSLMVWTLLGRCPIPSDVRKPVLGSSGTSRPPTRRARPGRGIRATRRCSVAPPASPCPTPSVCSTRCPTARPSTGRASPSGSTRGRSRRGRSRRRSPRSTSTLSGGSEGGSRPSVISSSGTGAARRTTRSRP